MGTWGAGSFENDDAMDWLGELAKATNWSVVRDALEVVTGKSPDEYLEGPEASVAIAAAELVSAAVDEPADTLPSEVKDWLSREVPDGSRELQGSRVTPEDVRDAMLAVDRVAESSELAELWSDSDDDGWRAAIVDLQKRLANAK